MENNIQYGMEDTKDIYIDSYDEMEDKRKDKR